MLAIRVSKNCEKCSNDKFQELVENAVYNILGRIVGEANDKLRNKSVINEKLTESIMFMKLTQKLQNGK